MSAIRWEKTLDMVKGERPPKPLCTTCNTLTVTIKKCTSCNIYHCESCVHWIHETYLCKGCFDCQISGA